MLKTVSEIDVSDVEFSWKAVIFIECLLVYLIHPQTLHGIYLHFIHKELAQLESHSSQGAELEFESRTFEPKLGLFL